jgi:cyclic pyranopterin phosphate synthase
MGASFSVRWAIASCPGRGSSARFSRAAGYGKGTPLSASQGNDSAVRRVDTLRISVTDRCNLRCVYCMPREGVPLIPCEEILRYEEILRIVTCGVRLGIRKLRITGGEPLVRRDVVDLVGALARIEGVDDLCMTTNGVLLKEFAPKLKAAGLHRVTVSLDSLRPDRYERITGSNCLARVLEGIESSLKLGLSPVKINVVLIRGANDDEVEDFAAWTLRFPLEVRFIERMPTGGVAGFGQSCGDRKGQGIPAEEVLERIRRAFGGLEPAKAGVKIPGPARLYRLPGGNGRVGVISAVTAPFCASCTRVRLTSDGRLRNCLFMEESFDLKELLRSGASDQALEAFLKRAIAAKPRNHAAPFERGRSPMSQIGG